MTRSLPHHTATRYVVPLREGGSLPAVLDTAEAGLFVAKFRGAGQGAKALVAEIVVGELARRLGLPVPEIALLDVDPAFGRTERDPEIQDLLKASRGTNVGLRYLDGAFNFDPLAAADLVAPELAADVVWLDALVTNVDRTPRNPNILVWNERAWLIDHGAALYFHHDWATVDAARARFPFPAIRDHVLLRLAGEVAAADERLAPRAAEALDEVVALVPDDLLMARVEGQEPPFATAEANRTAYRTYFHERLREPRPFVAAADEARVRAAEDPGQPLDYRR
ncbi:MAG TPA: HipA family kinase [Thermoanaerobaculia bacterium]|nr:HipA family kinase [Thermoanaerobaculia bacterium]